MKKIKQILKIIFCLFVITLIVILLSLQPMVSFYLANKSDNKIIIIGVILVIFTTSSITLFFDRKAITEYIKEQMRKVKGNFIWRPSVPIKNNKTTIQLIKKLSQGL
jgi:hypothetical protein